MLIFRHCLLSTIIMVVLVATDTKALTISWGNDLATNTLQESNGTALGAEFKFELGTFTDHSGGQPGTAIDPSGVSYSTWDTFWKPIDFAVDGAGWDPGLGTFARESDLIETAVGSNLARPTALGTSTDFFSDPQGGITGGEKLYLWVHNGTVLGGSDATQAALITATGWLIPDYETHTLPFEMNLQNADTAVVGSLSVKDVNLQLAAVPEPSAAALLLLTAAGGLAFSRKRCR
ncbi:MAG: PEP-CTERM sorting domain-containing protein [Verrucomicrobiales bacterium]